MLSPAKTVEAPSIATLLCHTAWEILHESYLKVFWQRNIFRSKFVQLQLHANRKASPNFFSVGISKSAQVPRSHWLLPRQSHSELGIY
jgi:hypothetical protein